MNSSTVTRGLIYLLVAVMAAGILWSVLNNDNGTTTVDIRTIAQQLQAGDIETITVSPNGRTVTAIYRTPNSRDAVTQISGEESLEAVLEFYGVTPETYRATETAIVYRQPSIWSTGLLSLAPLLLPVILIFGMFYFFMRQNQGANNQAMSFGKSRARMMTSDKPSVTFDDVAGSQEAKEELEEIVQFLRDPDKFVNFGARIPKGVLMVGPPGTGKTLMAKAVAGEAGVPFFSIAGSEFVEMFVGVGASRVRDMFEQAKRHSPCIIFIDEIDAVGRQRGAGLGGSHDEREQTLNQILVEMDGFDTDTHIIMMAATNRPDILDPALLRPGRFDRRVTMDRPDARGREEIFRVHMRGKPINKEVDVRILAKATPGFTGADIENMINESALLAARRDRTSIGMAEMQEAIERVQLGPERRSRVITQEEKELVAYHEAGHAIIAHLLPNGPAVRKVTIIPRGMAGGVTWMLEDDQVLLASTTAKLKAQIATALGGRVAEELVFGDITAGASNDLQQVTRIARTMVTQWGMSDTLGLRVYGQRQEMVFLGREISEQKDYSDAIAENIDTEVSKIITAEHQRVTHLLETHRERLDLIANKLLELETLEGPEFIALMEQALEPAEETSIA